MLSASGSAIVVRMAFVDVIRRGGDKGRASGLALNTAGAGSPEMPVRFRPRPKPGATVRSGAQAHGVYEGSRNV